MTSRSGSQARMAGSLRPKAPLQFQVTMRMLRCPRLDDTGFA
jgi:hypothetical protein